MNCSWYMSSNLKIIDSSRLVHEYIHGLCSQHGLPHRRIHAHRGSIRIVNDTHFSMLEHKPISRNTSLYHRTQAYMEARLNARTPAYITEARLNARTPAYITEARLNSRIHSRGGHSIVSLLMINSQSSIWTWLQNMHSDRVTMVTVSDPSVPKLHGTYQKLVLEIWCTCTRTGIRLELVTDILSCHLMVSSDISQTWTGNVHCDGKNMCQAPKRHDITATGTDGCINVSRTYQIRDKWANKHRANKDSLMMRQSERNTLNTQWQEITITK
jgi:hypothetical protein